jgi:dihydroneopterin aldolase
MPLEAQSTAIERSTIFLRGLRIDARVGVHVHERGGTQPLVMDIEIDVPMPACDEITATLDYVMAADMVRRAAMSRHFDLIETFAQEVGTVLLGIDGVRHLFIRVTKPSALAGSADSTGFELLLVRE